MRLLLALGLGTASAKKCQVCTAAKNHMEEFTGTYDQDCWEGNAKFEDDCDADTNVCMTEMLVDWLPRGGHQYIVKRLCAPADQANLEGSCETRSSSSVQYKDCKITCDGDNCNNDLDSVTDLLYVGKVESCFTCEYYQQSDGVVKGQPECVDEIPVLGNTIKSQKCPRYANAGCSASASAHQSYTGDEAVADEFRSCTPFEDVNRCYETEVNGIKHESCKSTCDTNNCNIQKHQMRTQCYTCSSTKGTSGALGQGTGDLRCWDEADLEDGMLADCKADEPYCLTEILVDWLAGGTQQAIITRGCSKTEVKDEGVCEEYEGMGGTAHKECQATCSNEDGPCNSGTLEHLFNEPNPVTECHTCYDINRLDGSVSGNEACIKEPGSIEGGTATCPYWAQRGCYQTISSHLVPSLDDAIHEDAYRGCSAFHLKEVESSGEFTCTNFDVNNNEQLEDIRYNSCKKSCTGRNCNTEYKNPLEESAVFACQVCQVTVNARNETVGIGDDDCWEGDPKYLQACPNTDQNYCVTDMEVDWLPRGEVEYRVRRGCSAREAPKNCFEGSTDLLQYKDCQESCNVVEDGNGCNNGLLSVAQRFAPENGGVSSCKACSYFQNQDGSVNGNLNCKENPDSVIEQDCPLYASTACYEASSFHKSYGGIGPGEVEDDYRGCSTFELPVEDETSETAANCVSVEINGLAHQNCKRTCTGDNCNVHRLQNRHTCYQCTATRNAQGEKIGVGDDRCFENPSGNSLVDCEEGEDYCFDEMVIDWLPRGDQVTRIIRGCSKTPAGECQGNDLPMTAYKDCYHSCVGDRCNDNFEVAKKFRPNDRRTFECQACQYIEYDNGDLVGNQFCKDKTGPNEANNFQYECPEYAQHGCFTAASTHVNNGEVKIELYKGCSTFPIGGNGIKQYDYNETNAEGVPQVFNVVKTFCAEDYDIEETYHGCNEEILLPDQIEDNKPIECYQCSVSVDQKNMTLGTGEQSCWDNPQQRHLKTCSIGQTCAVDMEIDWMSRGMMMYRLTRGCSDRKVDDPEPACKQGSTSLAQFKDCDVVCNEPGCNSGLDQVSARFDAGENAVQECYSCEYTEGKDGSVSGAPFCGASIADQEQDQVRVPTRTCPKYANSACFQASSLHEDYSDPSVDFEEDYRGCSTFNHISGDDFTCQTTSIDQISHLNCKSTCNENNCNTRGLTAGNTCYSCKVTYDTMYRPIGVGDVDCWFNVKDRHNVVCGENQPYCTTELKVDWLGRGAQIYELSRGCSATKPPSNCIETSSDAIKTKDCFDFCENGQVKGGKDSCNDDVWGVAKKFRPNPDKPLEGFYQPGCFGCNYLENDDGEVEGNIHCYDPTAPDGPPVAFGPCPVHASAGCYIGQSEHASPTGEIRHEVHKGCSVFMIDGGYESAEIDLPVTGGSSKHKISKETCQGQGCNAGSSFPDVETSTQSSSTQSSTQSSSQSSTESSSQSSSSSEPAPTTTEQPSTTAGHAKTLISFVALIATLLL